MIASTTLPQQASNYLAMHRAFTFFVTDEAGIGRVVSADTVAEAGRVMARYFKSPQHVVKFNVHESDGVPPVAQQIKNRLAKLAKVAALSGRIVSRNWRRDGGVVTVTVCK